MKKINLGISLKGIKIIVSMMNLQNHTKEKKNSNQMMIGKKAVKKLNLKAE